MRLSFFLTLFFYATFFSFSTLAQNRFPREHSIGITGGINLSKMTFRPTVIQDFKMGKTMGISYRYIEEKYFGIQAELLYTQRGWKDRLEEYPELQFERTLNYIELPILSHIFFGNDRFRVFFNLGPKFGLFLNDSKSTNINTPVEGVETAHQTMEISTKFDYGVTGGGGVELRFGRNSVLVECRYYFGLGDIYPNEKKDVFEASSNQNIAVTATYFFHLKRK